ncbi:PAP/OAS1 substrate-binding domain superfamily protein [Heracleum sosnowskyi]|uniref:PAP/OAS1 substrate-binding domain superfamily protein n=1 Tax=Heracleum sosnowskyi TaxID=360622 RepID=A0AAD8M8Z3_9APIA|nr:PAP/OAS1 substrate-binding domain superfamily protein [Heracleum sosnowskyi]
MEENSSISSSESSSDRSVPADPTAIGEDVWETAEQVAWDEVLASIHPTLDSEEKRKDVIEYVHKLIKRSIGVEVFPYGSVPLKTYLPDGDIDLTALSTPKSDDSLCCDVLAVMHAEQLNANAEFEVRDTQFIDAEVKLVKCLVDNIVIDMSFNQLGGLSTLCFLEQVDRLIAKDHLFKHSIILIKAWCYYESRILGAHHGLISTYALESLILYIFHMFNSSLNGPLAALHRFLVYYSKFDWENYTISLNGPVCTSYLPDLVVDNPDNEEEPVLSEEFLRNCVDMFSVSPKSSESNLRAFMKKNLNIIDPLKENNNLGRSVNRGNFFRIRSAFKFGARKLGNILRLPRDRLAEEIKNFFENTLERHGRQNASHICGDELARLPFTVYPYDDFHLNQFNGNFDHHMLGLEDNIRSASTNEPGRYSNSTVSPQVVVQTCYTPEGTVSFVDHFEKEYDDHVMNRSLRSGNTNVEPDFSLPGGGDSDSFVTNFNAGRFGDSAISIPEDTFSESISVDFRKKPLDGNSDDTESLNLADLSGDYDSHIRSLLYGQCCHGIPLSAPAKCSTLLSSPTHFQNKPWDTVRQYLPVIWKMNSNDAGFGHPPYAVDNSNPSTADFGLVERRIVRGTGTYIPHQKRNSSRERTFQARRNQPQNNRCQVQKNTSNYIVDSTSPRTSDANSIRINTFEGGDHQLVKEQSLVSSSEKQDSHNQPINSHGNGITTPKWELKFGSFGSLAEGNCSLGLKDAIAGTSVSSPASVQNSEGRDAENFLNLENDDDFPPLSS